MNASACRGVAGQPELEQVGLDELDASAVGWRRRRRPIGGASRASPGRGRRRSPRARPRRAGRRVGRSRGQLEDRAVRSGRQGQYRSRSPGSSDRSRSYSRRDRRGGSHGSVGGSITRSRSLPADRRAGGLAAASALMASSAARLAAIAVVSAWSYGGDTSTTSMPASSTAPTIWRIARRTSRVSIPPGSGVPVPGRHARVDDVDVEAEVDGVGAVERLVDRLGDDRLGPALLDLAHEVVAQARAPASTRRCRPAASSRAARPGRSCGPRPRPTRRAGASACRGRRARPSRRSPCRRGRRNGRCRCCPAGGPRRRPWRTAR